jgi:ribosomal protein S18 acetylase RimI-like enzyme
MKVKTRALAPRDLEGVVAIDAALSGRTRRAYFERRLAAAQRRLELHAQFAVEDDGTLAGYVLGRVMTGEFGRAEPAMRLEQIGVTRAAQGRGIGTALGTALEAEARRRGLPELHTAALWREHGMLRYLDARGWTLGRSLVLECALAESRIGAASEQPVVVSAHERPSDQHDYGAAAPNDFETLARDTAELRSLAPADLEDVARIDRRLTGRDRSDYMRARLDEALGEAAIRVSLIARKDATAAGYLMASADYGDFGRAEPVAVIDTIGVDPNFTRQGVARALLSQLFLNLRGLGIERVETVVGMRNPDLFSFLAAAGFHSGERLAFVKRLP